MSRGPCYLPLQQQHHHGQPQQQQQQQGPGPRRARITTCAAKDNKNSSSSSRPPTGSGGPWGWLQQLASTWQPARLAVNVLMLFFLMRLWPMGGRMGMSDNESVVIQVPFSEFVRHVKNNDVQTVSIDGLGINFGLRPGSLKLKSPSDTPEQKTQVTFSTVRPADYNVPYTLLESNGVQFSAVDKRSNRFLTILVRPQQLRIRAHRRCMHRLGVQRQPCVGAGSSISHWQQQQQPVAAAGL
jgi:hypothetical protein